MEMVHTVLVKNSFHAFHALRSGSGFLEESHAHDWNCEMEITGPALDSAGCVIDFIELDKRIGDVLGSLNGADLCNHQAFKGMSPSAEVIAQVLHGEMVSVLSDHAASIKSVTVWEDERHAGKYGVTA